MNHSFAVVIEPAGSNFSAYVPDLPGCVATGATREAALEEIFEPLFSVHAAQLIALHPLRRQR